MRAEIVPPVKPEREVVVRMTLNEAEALRGYIGLFKPYLIGVKGGTPGPEANYALYVALEVVTR